VQLTCLLGASLSQLRTFLAPVLNMVGKRVINVELLNANFVAPSSNTLSKHIVLTAVRRSIMCGSQLRVDCCSSQHCVACFHAILSMQPLIWVRQRSLYTHLQYWFMFLFVTLCISKMNYRIFR